MSIHNLNLVIFLSLSVALCSQVVAQDGSGTTTPAAQAAPVTPAAQAAPAAPNDKDLKEKMGFVIGYDTASNFKAGNPDVDVAQILEGMRDAEGSEDKSGYVFGYQLISRLKSQNIGLTGAHLEAGIKKAMAGEKLGMSSQETQMLQIAFRQMLEKKQMEERDKRMAARKKEGEDNKAKGDAYIAAQKAANPNVKELSDGVHYEVLKEGTGEKPGAKATVSVDYTGSFINGEVFDSSVNPPDGREAKPLNFRLSGGAIPGFLKALSAMSVGSKWRVIIPGDQAYGERGRGKIGPMETLIFELEILEVVDSGEPAADQAAPAVAPVSGK